MDVPDKINIVKIKCKKVWRKMKLTVLVSMFVICALEFIKPRKS